MAVPAHAYPGLTLGPASKYLAGPGTHQVGSSIVASLAGPTSVTTASKPSSLSSSSSSAAAAAAAANKNTTTSSSAPPDNNNNNSSSSTKLPTLSVARPGSSAASSRLAPVSRSVTRGSAVPVVGSVVLGVVTRVARERVTVAIGAVDGTVVATAPTSTTTTSSSSTNTNTPPPMTGVVRREDVRGWEVDRVATAELFRVGDVVRAAVLSVGDTNAYYLTTARNELGVLMARSGAGLAGEVDSDHEDREEDDDDDGGEEDMVGSGRWMVPVSWKEFRDPKTGRREARKVAKPV